MHDEPRITGHQWAVLATVLALCASLFVAAPSFGAGSAILTIETRNDTFENAGTMRADQTVAGGVANQNLGLRVIAPALTFRATYTSQNNRYLNRGTMRAGQTVAGGAANQNVGLEIVQ